MGNETWTIERIENEWADLRQGEYLYCVPVSQLPRNVEVGDRLTAPRSTGSGPSRWTEEEPRAKSA